MRKLYLTSFEFTTGENTYNEVRMVAAPNNLEAYEVAKIGFGTEFPQSKLIGLRVFQTYGDLTWKEEGTIALVEKGRQETFDKLIAGLDIFPLDIIFEGLKRNYNDGAKKAFLQDCIDHCNKEVY